MAEDPTKNLVLLDFLDIGISSWLIKGTQWWSSSDNVFFQGMGAQRMAVQGAGTVEHI